MRVSHRFTTGSARFDEDNLVSDAGLVPLLGLAEQTGLAEIHQEGVDHDTADQSGAANPARNCSPWSPECAPARTAAGPGASRTSGDMLVQNGQGHVAQQRAEDRP